MQNGICATGSWDKTIKYWDLRQSQPVATLQMPDRVYAMDVQGPLLVAGTAERHICVVDLNNPTTIFKQLQSPLKMQTRCISAFPDQKGYAVGSIEGRVAIQYIEDEKNNFSFKCHRKDAGPGNNIPKMQSLIWPVNAISFHQQQGTFSTAGADGTIYIWDKDSRTRLKTFDNRGGPIVATGFNHTGMVFAYAIAYDWQYASVSLPRPYFVVTK
ncbi:WD40 repeat-like protein [Atractiella rhizophila]|nr:WD40 repeat-like protein [Atractiella rhizophila]